MILRPVESEKYQVLGEAYIHGLEDSNGLLGRLPPSWKVVIHGDKKRGRPMYVFTISFLATSLEGLWYPLCLQLRSFPLQSSYSGKSPPLLKSSNADSKIIKT